jgi:rsbT co-antagonist protein RsbR
MVSRSTISEILEQHESEILNQWLEEITAASNRKGLIREAELKAECREFLSLFRSALRQDTGDSVESAAWTPVRDLLTTISRSRSTKGFTPSETAIFVFSLKQPLFSRLRQHLGQDGLALSETILVASQILDKLGLFTTEVYQKSREAIVLRQQEELMELSTPVVKLWHGVLALPLIGTLDSARTQVVMESLLQKIMETGSEVAIIDITGVPTVDTLTAQHLVKTITAARLMGADCIISGIRPQIAQTIVYLGIDLQNVVTKSTLADAFTLALKRIGMKVVRNED